MRIEKKFGNQRVLLIVDELRACLPALPYAVESSAPLPSELQNAWDQHQEPRTNVLMAVAGSHIGMMSKLQERQAPLYGRFTAQLPVGPLRASLAISPCWHGAAWRPALPLFRFD